MVKSIIILYNGGIKLYLDDRYPNDFERNRELINLMYDPANSAYFYGCISRTTDARGKKTYYNQPHYSIVYCVKGISTYVDSITGKKYKVTPGCVIQRMPNVPHCSILPGNSYWREFHITGSGYIFEALAKSGVISREPVFFVGEDENIHEKLIAYDEKHKDFDIHKTYEMIPDFVDIVLFLHNYKTELASIKWADKVIKILSQNINVNINLKDIAQKCNMDYDVMRKQFKKIFGCSMNEYRIKLRINEAKNLLLNHNLSIKDVASRLNYYDSYAFIRQFKEQTGVTPGKYVKDNKYV